MKLNWDIARCTGEDDNRTCMVRAECRRYTERGDAGIVTPHFEMPTDAHVQTGCELIIPELQH